MAIALAPFCVGMTAAAAVSYPTATIAGHKMVEIPGGHVVIGSATPQSIYGGDWRAIGRDAPPHWVSLSPYLIGETAVSESQYREIMGRPGRQGIPEDHPVTMMSYDKAVAYLKKRQGGLTLPTEAQWENAARGPAVNIPELMEEETGRFTPDDVVDFVKDRFENLVFEESGDIYSDPESEIFQKLMNQGRPFFGWRVYATPSGRFDREEVWVLKDRTPPGYWGTAPVNWGPKNAYGLYCMTGNVSEWVHDWYSGDGYMRGSVNPTGPDEGEGKVYRGSSFTLKEYNFQLSHRSYNLPDSANLDWGFRVAAPVDAIK